MSPISCDKQFSSCIVQSVVRQQHTGHDERIVRRAGLKTTATTRRIEIVLERYKRYRITQARFIISCIIYYTKYLLDHTWCC